MHKNYESPVVFLLLFKEDDIVRTSPTEGLIDGTNQDGWWGNDN